VASPSKGSAASPTSSTPASATPARSSARRAHVDGVERAHRQIGEVQARAREQLAHERVDLDDLALELVEGLASPPRERPSSSSTRMRASGGADLVRDAREQLTLIADLLWMRAAMSLMACRCRPSRPSATGAARRAPRGAPRRSPR